MRCARGGSPPAFAATRSSLGCSSEPAGHVDAVAPPSWPGTSVIPSLASPTGAPPARHPVRPGEAPRKRPTTTVLPMPPELTIRAGHPDFLDLPWGISLQEWEVGNRVDLPKGVSRHEVRF